MTRMSGSKLAYIHTFIMSETIISREYNPLSLYKALVKRINTTEYEQYSLVFGNISSEPFSNDKRIYKHRNIYVVLTDSVLFLTLKHPEITTCTVLEYMAEFPNG